MQLLRSFCLPRMLESSKSLTRAHFDLPNLPGKVGWREACVTAAARCRIELVAEE
jgi:hypothetical protein